MRYRWILYLPVTLEREAHDIVAPDTTAADLF